VIERLRHARQQGDVAALILAAHTLRGLAGNIGADSLASLAGQLEESLKSDPAPAAGLIDAMIEQLAAALQPILVPTQNPGAAPQQSSLAADDDKTGQKALLRLQYLLDNDDATAARYFDEISGWLAGQNEPALTEQLARQIARYEYEEALVTLQQLHSKLSH